MEAKEPGPRQSIPIPWRWYREKLWKTRLQTKIRPYLGLRSPVIQNRFSRPARWDPLCSEWYIASITWIARKTTITAGGRTPSTFLPTSGDQRAWMRQLGVLHQGGSKNLSCCWRRAILVFWGAWHEQLYVGYTPLPRMWFPEKWKRTTSLTGNQSHDLGIEKEHI